MGRIRRLMRAVISALVLHTKDETQWTARNHVRKLRIPREAFTTERQYQSSKAGDQRRPPLHYQKGRP